MRHGSRFDWVQIHKVDLELSLTIDSVHTLKGRQLWTHPNLLPAIGTMDVHAMYALVWHGCSEIDDHHAPVALDEVVSVEQVPVHDARLVDGVRSGHHLAAAP